MTAGEQFLTLPDAVDPDTELVRTQHAALLPFVAVCRCLTPLTMQQLWAVLGQPLVDEGAKLRVSPA